MNWGKKRKELARIYERFERDVRAFKREAVCRLGCTFCCTDVGNVDVNTIEAVVIRERMDTFPEARRRALEKRLARNRKERGRQSSARCAFLDDTGRCLIYEVRPFSCRQLYSLSKCDGQGPTVHRQAVSLAGEAVREIQRLDDTGYSGHLSFILCLLDDARFRRTYLRGEFDPSQIMEFGKSHGIIINRFAPQGPGRRLGQSASLSQNRILEG
jgi:hypothetical protein